MAQFQNLNMHAIESPKKLRDLLTSARLSSDGSILRGIGIGQTDRPRANSVETPFRCENNFCYKASKENDSATDGNLVVQHAPPIFKNKNVFDLMTVEAVAAALGKNPKTIKNWIAQRLIPFVRVGDKNMIRRKSFEAWLERMEVKPWR